MKGNIFNLIKHYLSFPEIFYFKKISIHEHFRLGGNMTPFILAMRFANIEKAVFLPSDWPPGNPRYKNNFSKLIELKKHYKNKILVFTSGYSKDPTTADFIEQSILKGAVGIKFIDWLYSKTTKHLIDDLDSENMYRVYQIAQKYQVPILLHIDFYKNPDWKNQFKKVLKDFPEVIFILPHYASCLHDSSFGPVSLLYELLDNFSNVYLDISSGNNIFQYVKIIDRYQKIFYDFFMKYQDRLLWGADIVLDKKSPYNNLETILRRFLLEFSILQKDKFQDPLNFFDKSYYQGLNLPEEILEKVYYQNSLKILKLKNGNQRLS